MQQPQGNFWSGTPGRHEQISTLQKNQQPLYNQLVNAGMGRGAGGAFGSASDYFQDLLSNDSNTYNQLAAPEMRKFREQILPQVNESFAGSYGGIGSSSHQLAAQNAGVDLAERLGAIRAQLRQQGAQGLANIGQQGLGQYSENVYYNPQPGFIDTFGKGLGQGLGGAAMGFATGGVPGAVAGGLGGLAKGWLENRGQQAITGALSGIGSGYRG